MLKSQAIENLLAQFPGKEEFPLDEEVLGEVATVEVAANEWVVEFDQFSTANSGGVGVVLYHREGETIALSFKIEFSCSNNTAEYEAYLIGLAMALEMGVQHLKIVGDSNLVVCQAKRSFSLKEPSLAPYRTLTQRMDEKFYMFRIDHAQRSENKYADAPATLGSQIAFERRNTTMEVKMQKESIIKVLKERFPEKEGCEKDWRSPIKEALLREKDVVELKTAKDYVLMKGEMYRRMLGGILSRCIGHEKAQKKLEEVHSKTYGFCRKVSLYRRLQRVGFYWPDMNKEPNQVQGQY